MICFPSRRYLGDAYRIAPAGAGAPYAEAGATKAFSDAARCAGLAVEAS